VSSCEEDPTKIGIGLLPGADFATLSSTDTLSVWSYTMYDDSVRTDSPVTSYLGQIYDPYFGTTTADFITEIRISKAWDDLPFTIDSVKLFLRITDVKGRPDLVHTLKISELADRIFPDSAYYSNTVVNTTGRSWSDIELPVLRPDTINNIALKLPVDFGNYITRDTSKLFYSTSNPDFRSYFKGLHFQISAGTEPVFLSLSLQTPALGTNPVNYFVFYMHDDENISKSIAFVLDATNRNARFNRFLHDFESAEEGKKIEHINNTAVRDTLTYLQSLNGVFTRIVFPGLEVLKNDTSLAHIAVNKARLSVPVYFDGDIYKPSQFPANLRLRYKISNGNRFDVPDYNLDEFHSFFDGKLDTVAGQYNFNIVTFIQGYLEDKTNSVKPELEIFQDPTGTKNAIFRANESKIPVRLEFTYSKF
jgi:hypothetical protein